MPLGSRNSAREFIESIAGGGLQRDSIFDILNNRRRRYIFHYLQQGDGTAQIGEISDTVAAWENETEIHEVPSEARQRVYVSLLQTHLPKLDSEDVVDFDDDTGEVSISDNAASMKIYLETVPENDILWAQYYLGSTAVAGSFVVLVWMGIRPFSEYPTLVWSLLALAFFVSALLHHRYLGAHRLGVEGPPPSEQ